MSDFAQRLRLNTTAGRPIGRALVMEAADRIEGLEAALREIVALETAGKRSWFTVQEIARAALAPEPEK